MRKTILLVLLAALVALPGCNIQGKASSLELVIQAINPVGETTFIADINQSQGVRMTVTVTAKYQASPISDSSFARLTLERMEIFYEGIDLPPYITPLRGYVGPSESLTLEDYLIPPQLISSPAFARVRNIKEFYARVKIYARDMRGNLTSDEQTVKIIVRRE